jgi:hypothetical protein
LLTDLLDWPGFPAVPEQFVLLIGGRLRQDAVTIQRLAAEQAAIDAVDHLASATDELHPDVPTRVAQHDVAPSPVAPPDVEPIHLEPLRFAQAPLQARFPMLRSRPRATNFEMLAEAVAGSPTSCVRISTNSDAPIGPPNCSISFTTASGILPARCSSCRCLRWKR